jgi:hypothetical protein
MTSITSLSNPGTMNMMRGVHHKHGGRGAEELAEQLFKKLDSSGQGFLKKADLQAALNDGSQAAKSVSSQDLDALFTKFDSNGDGQLSKQEFTDSVKKLADQLSQQLRLMDAQNATQNGGLIAPPAPAGETKGFTKDELSNALQQVGSSDGKRGNLLTALVQNFDQADTNGDGKLDVNEAVQFAKGADGASSPTATDTSNPVSSTDQKMMAQLMKLLQTYGEHGEHHQQASALQAVTA